MSTHSFDHVVQGRPNVRVRTFADPRAVAVASAERFAERALAAVNARGRFAVALSGGTAPTESYRLLASEPFRSSIPWNHVHLFWGDERCVTPGHPRSNFAMAYNAFVRHVPIPEANVHRMPGELPPGEGVRRYTDELGAFFGHEVPRFDLLHLGIGGDGHTASLFPFDALLLERDRIVGSALHRPLGEWRLTLTVPVLNAAREVEVLAFGRDKAAIIRTAVMGPTDPIRVPMQLVRPTNGAMVWMVDAAASPFAEDGAAAD